MENMNWYAMIIPMVLAIGFSVAPWTRTHVVSPYITVIHEYGHVVANVLTFGRPYGIKVRFGRGGGETNSMRPSGFLSGIGAIISGLSGYPAPIILGLALILSVPGDWSHYMNLIAAGLFTLFIFLMRNIAGILLALLTAGYFILACSDQVLSESMALAAGAVMLIGGIVDLLALIGYWIHGNAGETDIGILQGKFFLPQIFWLLLMLAGTAAVIFAIVALSLSL